MAESIECNSIERDYIEESNLNNQQFRLNKINKIKVYFIAEIKERQLMSKRLSKNIASFDSFDKSLIVLSCIFIVYRTCKKNKIKDKIAKKKAR